MKTQLTEIILINLIQHKSLKFSSHKTATVSKKGPKKNFLIQQFLFPKLSPYFSAYSLTEGNSSLVFILKLLIQLQSNRFFLNVDEY